MTPKRLRIVRPSRRRDRHSLRKSGLTQETPIRHGNPQVQYPPPFTPSRHFYLSRPSHPFSSSSGLHGSITTRTRPRVTVDVNGNYGEPRDTNEESVDPSFQTEKGQNWVPTNPETSDRFPTQQDREEGIQ